MNQIVQNTGSTAVAALQSLKQGLMNVKSTMKATSSDPYLRFGRDGVWVYGAENIEVEQGSKWAINILSLQHGFVSWTDYPENDKRSNEVVAEVMVPMTSALPDRDKLPPSEWPYSQQVAFQMKCVDGEDAGEQAIYKTTSVGGTNNVSKIIAAIMAQLDVDGEHCVPLVVLGQDSYQHKKWGKTYTPVMDIKGWVTLDGVAGDDAEVEDVKDTVAAAPAPTRKRGGSVPATKPEPVTQVAAADPGEETPAQRKARLLAELEALEGGDGTAPAPATETVAPATGPLRRRRA